MSADRFWQALHTVDYKFLLISLVFVALRMWTCIVNIVFIYAHLESAQIPTWLDKMLVYLAVSISINIHNATLKVYQHSLPYCIHPQVHDMISSNCMSVLSNS